MGQFRLQHPMLKRKLFKWHGVQTPLEEKLTPCYFAIIKNNMGHRRHEHEKSPHVKTQIV